MVLKDENGKPKVYQHESSFVNKGRLMDYETLHDFVIDTLVKEYKERKYDAIDTHSLGEENCDFRIKLPSGRIVCCKVVLTEDPFKDVIAKTDFAPLLDYCRKEKAFPRLYTVSAWCFATSEGSKMINGSTFAFKVDSISLLDKDEEPIEQVQSDETLLMAFANAWNDRDTTPLHSILDSHVHYSSSFVFDEIRGKKELIVYLTEVLSRLKATSNESKLTLCTDKGTGAFALADKYKNGLFTFVINNSRIEDIRLDRLNKEKVEFFDDTKDEDVNLTSDNREETESSEIKNDEAQINATKVLQDSIAAEKESDISPRPSDNSSAGTSGSDEPQKEKKDDNNDGITTSRTVEAIDRSTRETASSKKDDVVVTDVKEKKQFVSVAQSTSPIEKGVSRHNKKIDWRRILPIALPALLGAALLSLIIVVLAGQYPENFNSFGAKFKYRFSIPNNRLAKEYLVKYRSAEQAGLDEMSIEFAETAYNANPSSQTVIDTMARAFVDLGNNNTNDIPFYKKAIEISERGLKRNPDDKYLMKEYIIASYNLSLNPKSSEINPKSLRENAYKMSEKLLLIDSQAPIALNMMCNKAHDQKDWSALLKWSQKALELKESPYPEEFLYFYAKALYENGEYEKALETYTAAEKIDKDDYLHGIYAKIGGVPCKVLSVAVENRTKDGVVLTKAGDAIYNNNTQYLCPVLNVKSYREGYFIFQVRFYKNGVLCTGDSSPSGYTYNSHVYLTLSDSQTIRLSGWGSDTPGYWDEGNYRIEIWWEGEMLYSHSFKVYPRY